jgi:riboflavin kinase/FMN adenylyltransferase
MASSGVIPKSFLGPSGAASGKLLRSRAHWTTAEARSNSVAVRNRRHAGSERIDSDRPSLVVVGNFDGVHRGHRAVIESAVRTARAAGLLPLVLTFDPHPASVLGRGVRPPLTTVARKVELLLELDPELEVVVEPFTVALSQRTPTEFVETVLARRLHAHAVIVGENFRFGHNRAGGLAELRELGKSYGFEARAETLIGDDEGLFSSTRARAALAAGDLRAVTRCLGRPHSISGTVVHGAARGRTIGFPTANIDGVAEALPPFGVYACRVDRIHEGAAAEPLADAVLNLGVRPTLAAGFSVEAHLFDFESDLYEQTLRVHLIERLRDELRFASFDALKEQIVRDAENARRVLSS